MILIEKRVNIQKYHKKSRDSTQIFKKRSQNMPYKILNFSPPSYTTNVISAISNASRKKYANAINNDK